MTTRHRLLGSRNRYSSQLNDAEDENQTASTLGRVAAAEAGNTVLYLYYSRRTGARQDLPAYGRSS